MIQRVVFICACILLLASPSVSSESTQVYQFEDYQIHTTLIRVDDGLGYELVKIGSNPFSRTLVYDDSSIHINDIIELDDLHVIYGYIHIGGEETYYEGFITVLSATGEELHHQVFDYELEEDVRAVYQLDQMIVVAVLSVTQNEREQYDFAHWTFHALDYSYEEWNHVTIVEDIDTMTATEDLVLLDIEGDGTYDIALDEQLNKMLASDPLPIETDQVFQERVRIPFLNRAYLNQEPHDNGVVIDYPGHYALEYGGFVYRFTVDTNITGVDDGGVYNESVVINISSGQALLNGDLYTSGTPLDQPGQYDLVVKGVGGYRQARSFQITSNLNGVHHNGTYTEPVELSFHGQGYLNNQFITSPYTVEEPGEYLFTIRGENDYNETYFFLIDDPQEGKTLLDFLMQFDLYILGITLISGFLVMRKK